MRALLSLFILISSLGAPAMSAPVAGDPLNTDPQPEHMFPPSIEELTFLSGESRLSGLLYLANGKGPHPTVILLHGFPGNEKNLDIAQVLRRAGFNVMFFHYRGAWGSEGDYSLKQLPGDVAAAVSFVRSNTTRYRIDSRRLTLLGHSMGAYAALAAGQKDAGLACIAAMAPFNPGLLAEGIRAGEPSASNFLDYADGLFMLRNFDGAAMRKELLSIPPWQLDIRMFGAGLRGKSILMIAGENDTVVPTEAMFDPTIAAYARDPAIKLRHFTITGDHSFSWSRIQLTELVLNWLQDQCS